MVMTLNFDQSKPRIKYVKKAKQWCKTYWENGVQKQEWFDTKEEAEK